MSDDSTGILPDAALPGSGHVADLAAYWDRSRGGRTMPARGDIDPVEMPGLLPYLSLWSVEPATGRLHCRLVGTRSVTKAGFDYTGHYLDELDFSDQTETDWSALFAAAITDRRPVVGHAALFCRDGSRTDCAFGIFPMSSDAVSVNQCLMLEDVPYDQALRIRPAIRPSSSAATRSSSARTVRDQPVRSTGPEPRQFSRAG